MRAWAGRCCRGDLVFGKVTLVRAGGCPYLLAHMGPKEEKKRAGSAAAAFLRLGTSQGRRQVAGAGGVAWGE